MGLVMKNLFQPSELQAETNDAADFCQGISEQNCMIQRAKPIVKSSDSVIR